jgi:hypothetical protein
MITNLKEIGLIRISWDPNPILMVEGLQESCLILS